VSTVAVTEAEPPTETGTVMVVGPRVGSLESIVTVAVMLPEEAAGAEGGAAAAFAGAEIAIPASVGGKTG